MASPFPGMNPYLESPDLWTEVHHRLISAIAAAIEPNLPPNYRVAIEKRVYSQTPDDSVLVGIPDVAVLSRRTGTALPTATLVAEPQAVNGAITITLPMPEEVRESYLEIRDMAQGDVITSIEVLSPTNKRVGKGRDAYLAKREDLFASATHLIELDLLREGLPFVRLESLPRSAYRILVSRSERRPYAELYPAGLRQELPTIAVPLRSGDEMPLLPLQSLLLTLYDQARYDLAIDYQRDPVPALKGDDLMWCGELLRAAGRREI
jgi:Protein of unknown function (DUF4058)